MSMSMCMYVLYISARPRCSPVFRQLRDSGAGPQRRRQGPRWQQTIIELNRIV